MKRLRAKLNKKTAALLACAALGSTSVRAQQYEADSFIPASASLVPHDINACWKEAAKYHGVDVWLLYSIAWVESRMNPASVGRNTNGSVDLGMMQINTIWLPELAKYGIQRDQLMDGCTSIYIGAWIMSKNFKTYGYTWRAIGAYNSGNVSIGYKYAQRVYDTHRRITGMPTVYSTYPGQSR